MNKLNFKNIQINTIYRQLLINIVIPVLLAVLLIGLFSYRNTRDILENNLKTEKQFTYNEIKSFIELQFVALSIIEEPVTKTMHQISDSLVNHFFKQTKNIETANLDLILKKLSLNPDEFDLYIINRDGIVVNTTFKEDLFINFFSFGIAHERYLKNVFANGAFDSPRFFFENKTKRYKKYSYQPTKDGKYIIEIGTYSEQADKIYDYTINHLLKIPEQESKIITIDLFFWADKPYPLNLKREFYPEHINVVESIINGKEESVTATLEHQKNRQFTYLFLKSSSIKLFEGVIVRIAGDVSGQRDFMMKEGLKITVVVLLLFMAIFILLNYRAKRIVSPIRQLIELTKKIIEGDLSHQVSIEGNNEIAELSGLFNTMSERLNERNHQIEEQQEFLYQSNRKLNQAYKLLDQQKSIIENKQDDLTASINYAQRIQGSLMPSIDEFKRYFDDSFIYMLPRDIVSGDFYWFARIQNKAIVVVSDCTGHGVPGAFMSMVGITILHHLVHHQHISDPAVLLAKLDVEICDLLVFNKSDEDQRFEGMDVSICSIDYETNRLTFASAQRPIILIREGKPTTYKGSVYPIGEYYDNIQKIFHNLQIELEEGDVIYMFSDGYTSQFNDDYTKKFNYNRFKKLLSDINAKKLKDQPAVIHRTLEAWKGDTNQIDDILIVGFRYTKTTKFRTISAKSVIEDTSFE